MANNSKYRRYPSLQAPCALQRPLPTSLYQLRCDDVICMLGGLEKSSSPLRGGPWHKVDWRKFVGGYEEEGGAWLWSVMVGKMWWFRSLRRSAVVDFANAVGGDDGEGYGEVIKGPSEEGVQLTELRTEGRSRGVLLLPSSTSLSPHLVPGLSGSYEQARFPIQPPPSDKRLTVSYFPSHRKDWGIPDSIKSMNTNGSVNSPLSRWSWYEADASGSVDSRGMTTTCCFATSHLTLQGTCDIFA